MQEGKINIHRAANGVTRIAIDRVQRRNALTPGLRAELTESLERALADPEVFAILLTGEGNWFCAGGDLDSMAGLDHQSAQSRIAAGHDLVRTLLQSEKPILAAVEGGAFGAGAGLALLADQIVMSDVASVGFPFLQIGLMPDFGVMQTLPARVGIAHARKMIFDMKPVPATEALALGLVDYLAPPGGAESRAAELLGQLVSLPPQAFALTKRQLAAWPFTIDAALEAEAEGQLRCFLGEELVEGQRAFRSRTKPDFRRPAQ